MFWFVIAGTKEVVKRSGEGSSEIRFCPRCGEPRRFHPAERRNHVTLFFLPLFPLGASRSCLACETCGLCLAPGPHWTCNVNPNP